MIAQRRLWASVVPAIVVTTAMVAAQVPEPAKPREPLPRTQPGLPSGRQIVDRHVKAIGGRAAVLSYTSSHVSGTISVPGSGLTGTMEAYGATNPDRILLRVTVAGIGEIVNGFDGSHGWSMTPMTGPMLQTGRELQQTRLDADFYGELRDPLRYTRITTLEKTTFEGRPCYKVSLVRTDGSEDIDFYDTQTGLRAGSLNTRETPMGTVTTTSVESGYKRFGRLLQPTLLVQRTMGVENRIAIDGYEYDSVDPSVFNLPPPIQALIK